MIELKLGHIFDNDANFLVNTVNCKGAMGKGIALLFKQKFPSMFEEYKKDCIDGKYSPGCVKIYQIDDVVIANAATKLHWKNPSNYKWIGDCISNLAKILTLYPNHICAIPPLGCGNGGLDYSIVKPMILKGLEKIPNRVYLF